MAKGWTSPSTSVRKPFSQHASVVGPARTENERVTSKNVRRYGANETTGEQPVRDVYRDPVNGDAPITHHNEPFQRHIETVGWHPHTGEFVHATHPNAEAKAAGNAKHTHPPLEPVGQTHSKYGGEHGEPQTLPESDTTRGATHREFRHNHPIDAEPQRRGKSTGFNR